MSIRLSFLQSPVLTYTLRQMCFWFILHIFLSLFLYLGFIFLLSTLSVSAPLNVLHILSYAIFLALFHGIVLGVTNYFIDKHFQVAKSLKQVMILQFITSIVVFIITSVTLREYTGQRFYPEKTFDEQTWQYLFCLLFLQYSFGSMVVSFSNQTFRKYGRDVFLPMLLGVYRSPRLENKLFMFLDLKASTSLAERLGHIAYSSLVQEFMMDVNKCLSGHRANIYQYAGDEVIVTWNTSHENALQCLKFFFAVENRIEKRSTEYQKKYGVIPSFKAGVDCGRVTAVEIGDIKRDIAYHGDTVNTASRIQAQCNIVDKKFLVSRVVYDLISPTQPFVMESVGSYLLKGKEKPVNLYSVSQLKRAGRS
jgi:adenylate cyclase